MCTRVTNSCHAGGTRLGRRGGSSRQPSTTSTTSTSDGTSEATPSSGTGSAAQCETTTCRTSTRSKHAAAKLRSPLSPRRAPSHDDLGTAAQLAGSPDIASQIDSKIRSSHEKNPKKERNV